MIKNLFSRWSWRYPDLLVYMLQTSEYHFGHFFKWYWRASDFCAASIARRKKLVFTPKAIFLLASAWLFLLSWQAAGLLVLYQAKRWWKLLSLTVFLTAPWGVVFLLAGELFLLQLVAQKPWEGLIVWQTRRRLAAHPGIKVAVAGSFGKTTMREILKTALSAGGKTAASPKNYNTPLGISRFVRRLKGDEKFLVFELGEYYPGDIRRLCRLVQPQLGVITGVNEAHLERFGSLQKTAAAVLELADWLKTAPLYVNGESVLARKYAPPPAALYDRGGVDGWRTGNKQTGLKGTSFTLTKGELKLEVKSKLLGLHQVGPLAAAAAIACRLGINPQKAVQQLELLPPLPHRLNPGESNKAVIVDDSYNGSPDGAAAAIAFLKVLRSRCRIYVTPGLVEMGKQMEAVHRRIGRQLAEAGIEKIFLIKNSVTSFIKKGLEEANYRGEVRWFDSAPAVLSALPFLLADGDIALIQNDWGDQYC